MVVAAIQTRQSNHAWTDDGHAIQKWNGMDGKPWLAAHQLAMLFTSKTASFKSF